MRTDTTLFVDGNAMTTWRELFCDDAAGVPPFRKMRYDPQQPMPALGAALACGPPESGFRISPQPDMLAPK